MPPAQIMCKQCATFARNKRSNAWQHAHLRDIVAVRIAQLVRVSWQNYAQRCRTVGLRATKMARRGTLFCGAMRDSFAGKCQGGIIKETKQSKYLPTPIRKLFTG